MTVPTVGQASTDAGAFAEVLLGEPLWGHQLDLVRSPARYRVVVAGRQAGKSRALAVLALHEAATRRNRTVLIVSAGETAARRLLEECAALASASPLLRGSVVDESTSTLVLSTGSTIRSVPASQRQIRGWAVDLLIVDEAAFVDAEVWRAAEPSIIARPGSRVVLCSSPWGGVTSWFRMLWRRGMDHPDGKVRSWHWPSAVSPLVDAGLLEEIRSRESPLVYAREYLAEFVDDGTSLFAPDELSAAVCPVPMPDLTLPTRGPRPSFAVGVDWGAARDATAAAVLGLVDDDGVNPRPVFAVPVVRQWVHARYADVVDEMATMARWPGSQLTMWASEVNGVGAAVTESLQDRLFRQSARVEQGGHGYWAFTRPVWTDARRKQSGYGQLKLLVQSGQLLLPDDPDLLRQLGALQISHSDAGTMRVEVPDNVGHDDAADALMQAVSCVRMEAAERRQAMWRQASRWGERREGFVTLASGARVPSPLRFADDVNLFSVKGAERGTEGTW